MRAFLGPLIVLASCQSSDGNTDRADADAVGHPEEVAPSTAEAHSAWQFASDFNPDQTNWSICRSSVVPKGARLGNVGTILGRQDLFRLGDNESCQLTVRARTADLSLSQRVELPSCIMAYEASGPRVQKIEVASDTNLPVDLQKCLFRIGLWIEGNPGAITGTDGDLFIPVGASRWQGLGPSMPDVVPREL